MSNIYLAVYCGTKDSPRTKAWQALSESERQKKQQEGIAAWRAWGEKHASAIVHGGGPLGKTKKISGAGIADVSNELAGCVMVRADSHEAAAKMFENHPHFTIFPGDRVEVMPVLPSPGG